MICLMTKGPSAIAGVGVAASIVVIQQLLTNAVILRALPDKLYNFEVKPHKVIIICRSLKRPII